MTQGSRARAGLRLVKAALLVLGMVACGPKEDITPEIAVSPGVEARLMMMDRYRLHDEDRRRMMVRPHVWVEGVPEEADGGTDGGGE